MKPPSFLIVALWLSSTVARSAQECRNEYKKLRPTHTACKPANKECTIKKKGVSAAERQLILKSHNYYRSMVATGKLRGFPQATNMRQLEWNEELASVAQAKAEQCTDRRGTLKHDSPEERFITEFNKTGQNLAFRRSNIPFNGTDWPTQIKAWFDGHSHYSPGNVNRFSASSESPAGHFTQVVWATVRYVGCGYVDYTVAGVSVMPHMQLYVCNYAGAGNVLTLPVYQAGEVCSACPNDTACAKDTGLCTLSSSRIKGRELACVYTCLSIFLAQEKEDDGTPCWVSKFFLRTQAYNFMEVCLSAYEDFEFFEALSSCP
ncbi:scoloptoxin SSD976-like [Dermacentor variabilis]|uniref:scoloptoxin SSD976-like n=1 Tax=Dermacentor variabilis TaxID=34621 RepID=UPI003F5B1107